MKNRYSQQGFNLIELMIVVAIIGVLAAIAYPSYQRYVIKTKRTDMMTEMQNIASRIESQKLALGRYTDIPLALVLTGSVTSGTVGYPATNALYDVSIWDASTTPAVKMIGNNITNRQWGIRAEPRTSKQMANDGRLTLNAQGLKCRDKNNDGDTQDTGECGMANEWNN
ncbi:MAG TPA: pilus assembly protein PilE [Moraxellaceae bacterium]|nr:prepilin-type N-terminal cleavage/methylation domain-containing protein [Moraxella sp.]HBI48568.1 pilus assembly protein PilE [Moraxellaceae bacterium]